MATLVEIHLGDLAQLKKKHPCGSDTWEVVRVGADIGIRCQGCGRRVLLPRSKFARRVRALTTPEKAPSEAQP